jgi:hypothetical protein
MKHTFIASLNNKGECATCKRDYISHTKAAICEACSNVGECDIFGNPSNPKAMLLCVDCLSKEQEINNNILLRTQVSINEKSVLDTIEKDIVEQSKEIDNSIQFSGDIFNAETIGLAQLKAAVLANEHNGNSDERMFVYQKLVIERIEHYKSVIFQLDEEKHKLVSKQRAAIENLREFGSQLRQEIRDRIKQSDSTYTPHQVVKIPKISKPKVSAYDRLIESLATMKGISKEEAEKLIKTAQTT